MKKITCTALCCMLVSIVLFSCGKSNSGSKEKPGTNDSTKGISANEVPMDFRADTLPYDSAYNWHQAYLGHSKRIKFLGGSNSGETIKGFRIRRTAIDSIFDLNEGAEELYVFFGVGDDVCLSKNGSEAYQEKGMAGRDFTLIFAGIKPCQEDCNSCTGGCIGEVCREMLFDYVDPCPTKCPKFKK